MIFVEGQNGFTFKETNKAQEIKSKNCSDKNSWRKIVYW